MNANFTRLLVHIYAKFFHPKDSGKLIAFLHQVLYGNSNISDSNIFDFDRICHIFMICGKYSLFVHHYSHTEKSMEGKPWFLDFRIRSIRSLWLLISISLLQSTTHKKNGRGDPHILFELLLKTVAMSWWFTRLQNHSFSSICYLLLDMFIHYDCLILFHVRVDLFVYFKLHFHQI